MVVLCLLILLVFFMWLRGSRRAGEKEKVIDSLTYSEEVGKGAADTSTALDTLSQASREGQDPDTAGPVPRAFPQEQTTTAQPASTSGSTPKGEDTVSAEMSFADSLMRVDTAGERGASESLDPCEADTVAPWVYPDPSGGLHRGEIAVSLVATESCHVEWRIDTAGTWREYRGTPITVESTLVLMFRAQDTCGNRMPPRAERYEIEYGPSRAVCPDDMELITLGDTRFCIDRYEWPNRKGALPARYVSIYQAMDSCFSVGKRLCSTDEWKLACSGPYGWAYPYGEVYEPRACVTQDTTLHVSGSKPECRGYFEVFDMSGNLQEWTDTRARENKQFYNVLGGFWESGPRSGCFTVRYSYYPQNRHNPVGFRCCKDAAPE